MGDKVMNEKHLEVAGMVGEFDISLYDNTGKLKVTRHVKNLTVNGGFAAICDAMGAGSVQPFKYCAIGTGTTAPSAAQTALTTQNARVLGGYTKVANTIWKNDSTFPAGTGTGAVTESGMFNHETAGTMLCRQTFPVINKGADDTLIVTWTYTLS